MGAMLLAGLLSGLLSHVALDHGWLEGLRLFDVALVVGLAYAAVVGGWLAVRGPGRSPAVLGWAALVVGAWVAAVRVAAEGADPVALALQGRGSLALAGALGGLVGGAGVAAANTLLLPVTRSSRAILTVTAVGAVAGLSILWSDSFWPLLLLWQGAVAGATGYVVERA